MVADDRPVKNQAFYLVRALSGFSVDPAREGGDKLTRFGPFSSQCRAGNVKIRRGGAPWQGGAFQWVQVPPGASLPPEAIGAVMEVTKWLKPSISRSRIGDRASVQAATRVNAEQASKRTMCRPTRRPLPGKADTAG